MQNAILLVIVVYIVYLHVGTLIYYTLGRKHRLVISDKIEEERANVLAIIKIIKAHNISDETVGRVADILIARFLDRNYGTHEEMLDIEQWDFYYAFVYVISITSCIGYGSVPKPIRQPAQQALTILVGITGIPVHILITEEIGLRHKKSLYTLLKGSGYERGEFRYLKFWCLHLVFYLLVWVVSLFVFPTFVFMYSEEWSFIEGLYFCFTFISAIGSTDKFPTRDAENNFLGIVKGVAFYAWLLIGMGFASMMFNYEAHYMIFHVLRNCPFPFCRLEITKYYVEMPYLFFHQATSRIVRHPLYELELTEMCEYDYINIKLKKILFQMRDLTKAYTESHDRLQEKKTELKTVYWTKIHQKICFQ